jgi:hypothetical protein
MAQIRVASLATRLPSSASTAPPGDPHVGPAVDTVLRMDDRVILMGQESELEAIRPVRAS